MNMFDHNNNVSNLQKVEITQYHTKEIPIISMLELNCIEMTGTYKQGDSAFFVFGDFKKCKEIEENYYAGKLTVDPRKFYEKTLSIRNYIQDHVMKRR